MGTMFDAVNSSAIPVNAEIVAGYINGRYAWKAEDWAKFPKAAKVRILVYIPGMTRVVDDGDVLDVEASDAPTAAAIRYAAAWVDARRKAGIHPVIYTSKSGLLTLGKIKADWWIADPTDKPHLLPGTVATQYSWKRTYDISMTAPGWPTSLQKETPQVATPNSPCAGFKATPTGKGYYMIGTDGGVFTFGDAEFHGSLGDKTLNAPIIGIELTPSGNGYWLFARDYGVFAFGDAEYLGHPGA